MAVTRQDPINVSQANGFTTTFPYNFLVLDAADLLVRVSGVQRVLNVDYTVTGVGNQGGGNVVFSVAPEFGTTVVRQRQMSIDRPNDYQTNGDFASEEVNRDFDRPIMMIQEIAEAVDRALLLPPELAGTVSLLPQPESLRGVRWNAAANGLENYTISDFTHPDGAANVGYTPAGSGAIYRDVQSKLREVVSPEDFGAVGDGVTNDRAALQACSDYIMALPAGGVIRLMPGKRYAVGSTWAVAKTDGKRFIIDGQGATLLNLPAHDGVILSYGAPSESTPGFPLEIHNVTFRGQSANATGIALEWAGVSHIQDCFFLNLRNGVFSTNGFALRFTGCQFLFCSVGGIVSSTIGHNMAIDRCGFFVNTRDVYFLGAAYNFSAFQCDFEGGQTCMEFAAGGAAITIDSCYIEGKSGNQFVLGAATSSVMQRGCWHGYNSGAQNWSNATSGVIEGNIFWNQTVTLGTAVDIDIGANTWAGTSVAVYPPWAAPTLISSFTNSGAPYHNAGYRKGRDGCVYLRGSVTGPADNVAFTLPVGYRPASNMSFLCPAAGGGTSAARVNINSGGSVTVFRAADSSAILDNIRFIAGA